MQQHQNQPKVRFTAVDHLWTTRLQQLAIAQQLTFETQTKGNAVKGIDKRTHKDRCRLAVKLQEANGNLPMAA